MNILHKLKCTLGRRSLECLYISFIHPFFEYGYIIFDNMSTLSKPNLKKIIKKQQK